MPRFRNISGDDRHIGRVDGPLVKAGEVHTVDGEVLAELDDAYVTGTPGADELLDADTKERLGFTGDARAWPKSAWELIPEPKSAKGE